MTSTEGRPLAIWATQAPHAYILLHEFHSRPASTEFCLRGVDRKPTFLFVEVSAFSGIFEAYSMDSCWRSSLWLMTWFTVYASEIIIKKDLGLCPTGAVACYLVMYISVETDCQIISMSVTWNWMWNTLVPKPCQYHFQYTHHFAYLCIYLYLYMCFLIISYQETQKCKRILKTIQ